VYAKLREPLAKLYPQYQFHLLSEQKSVLEKEAKKLFPNSFAAHENLTIEI